MRIFFLFIIFLSSIYALEVEELKWEKGVAFVTFLEKYNIPQETYFNLSKTDKELCSEIIAGVEFQIVKDHNSSLLQALIPISEEMQIHLSKNTTDNTDNISYSLEIIPIVYTTETTRLVVPIKTSIYQDILEYTYNKDLADEFVKIFQKSIDFTKLQKNDMLVLKYEQKIRMNKYFGSPKILGAYVKMKYQTDKFVFLNHEDGRYYDDKGKSLSNVLFKTPLQYKRISSKFTHKRYHPIENRYKSHLGVDFAAPMGRKVWSTADGKIIFRGYRGGYGNTVEIQHANGYKSLYAHLSKFNHQAKVGKYIKKGDTIGYVGTSGLSTGAHLHFGLYKNNNALNPLKVLRYATTILKGKQKTEFLNNTQELKQELVNLEIPTNNLNLRKYSLTSNTNNNKYSKISNNL